MRTVAKFVKCSLIDVSLGFRGWGWGVGGIKREEKDNVQHFSSSPKPDMFTVLFLLSHYTKLCYASACVCTQNHVC